MTVIWPTYGASSESTQSQHVQGDVRGSFDRGALPPPPPPARNDRASGWDSWGPGSREGGGWRGGALRLPPPPMRRQHSSGREAPDFEAGELAGPGEPPLSRSGWDQKPGLASGGAREGRYGGGISRTASLPLGGRMSAPEAMPLAPDLPGPPPLLRSVSHPAARPVSPLHSSANRPLPNGSSSFEAHWPMAEEQHTRSSNFPVAYTPLPHHLVSQPSHSLPPGIMSRRTDLPLPPAPPLLASPVLPDLAMPAADGGAPSLALLRPAEAASAGGVTPARQLPEADFETGELSTPAGSVAGDANATPVSDDPPKRKRLGWGQGLARLRSVDKRGLPADDHSEHSPRDSEASRHTDAGAHDSSALNSPSFSARTDDAAPAAALSPAVPGPDAAAAATAAVAASAEEPAGSALPPPPALLIVEPAVVIEAPVEAATSAPPPSPLQPAALTPIRGPEEVPAAAAAPLASTPQSPKDRPTIFTPSPEARAPVVSPSLPPQLPPSVSAEPSPLKREAIAAHEGESPVPEPVKAAGQQGAEQKPSKEVIMRKIDTADSEIEALERQMAELSSALDADAAAARDLAEEITHLETARPMETQPSEEESSIAQSTQVHFLPCMLYTTDAILNH